MSGRGRTPAGDREAARRSHAAIPVAVALDVAAYFLAGYTLLAPAVIGLVLLGSGFSLLSSRINPLSPNFYSSRKASWSAIGVVFLSGFALLVYAYYLWKDRLATLLPHL